MQTNCKNCGDTFEISNEDLTFYDKISPVFNNKKYQIPSPTFCPSCRMQRRLSYRNERFLYHRKCDMTGKEIISSASQDKPYPIYDIDSWWSDKWDPLSYGINFDFNKSFLEQFEILRNKVPRMNLQQQKPMENSDYCNCASRNKNCYLVFSTNHCEDCYYGSWINYSKNCIDNQCLLQGELCYECIDCKDCYNLKFSQQCKNCSDSYFLKNCIGTQNSIFCTNLHNKNYYIFNKQYTKENYKNILKNLDLSSFKILEKAKSDFKEFTKNMIVKEYFGSQNENISGNIINNCKNTFESYECYDCEDVKYCMRLESNVKNCMDYVHWGMNAEMIYESQACGYNVFNLKFCNLCWGDCSDLIYCDHCTTCNNCFGCISLKHKSYCILNQQYTKEEYEKLVPKIIEAMKFPKSPLTRGLGHPLDKGGLGDCEWGEFFPISISVFSYNETLANEEFQLTKNEALAKKYSWKNEDLSSQHQGPNYQISDNIKDIKDDICNAILTCDTTGKLYKIIPQELKFYRQMNLPIPRKCPEQRQKNRTALRNPRKLWTRNCMKCGEKIITTYAPSRPEIVYCEKCYLESLY
ncbi:MAG: hypothetical protein UR28_C0006G0019 [Candidatus Peregrinibacteria bacterium GW2011_GWF2_33_10]|nr:MAG: hypothetical protein UR28_C0006G0019 [Candidatus Peregrinibacteria bacterium GW2011_GWF2_33_10]OGJ45062.1 MAG: hypothetical protein A2263_02400 [Candidatus Peregrinibacteria bacterium RIFOXYA2_FULL_33_21]OGJ46055.1 MAG: hypothetical protein A2272_02045 [Candidatus Peregrinibacteria bacterium RIFOXYA12_FULL_33_12]OGJ50854.1 MAG: hypothetical protein A2307_00655 [Candidatus Peregrinibacteria bacterium RIFOXYB2_FULL_33_20]